jgi:hypothetical protein
MRALVKGICVTLLVLALLITVPITYSTAHGYTNWWFRYGGNVAVDGDRNGYLHTNSSRTAVIVTRTDSKMRQSYLVQVSGSKSLIYCGDWQAPQFPIFPIGDVNPPCLGFLNDPVSPEADRPLNSTLRAGPGFVEFFTKRGKKVTASW